MTQVTCDIVEAFNQITNEVEAKWDDLIVKTSANIYMTCTWCRVWWENYGKGRVLRIFLYYQSGELVAVLPIYINRIRVGPFSIRVARFVGANNPMRVFDPPMSREFVQQIFSHLVKHLTQTERCDVVGFGPYSKEFRARYSPCTAVIESVDTCKQVKETSWGLYTYFQLPETHEEYLASLSKNRKHRRKYDIKTLCKEFDIKLDILKTAQQIGSDFHLFVKLHALQWNAQGKPGHFGAWPGSERFHERLAIEFAKQNRTRLLRITADGKPIIYEYCYMFGDRCYWLLPARIIGAQWDRLSLGATALVELIRQAIEEKITFVEAGVSRYDYKLKMGAKESSVYGLRLTSSRLGGILRDTLLKTTFFAIDLLYYKIWYRRIQPRLKFCMHLPIWSVWIDLNI